MARVEPRVTQLSSSEVLSPEGKQPQTLPGARDGGGGGTQQGNYRALCDLKHAMPESTNKNFLTHSKKGCVGMCVCIKFV